MAVIVLWNFRQLQSSAVSLLSTDTHSVMWANSITRLNETVTQTVLGRLVSLKRYESAILAVLTCTTPKRSK